MLTRLQVTGFKNLMDVDILFGPFTCIAGENGVGKSNLFDAILFLSALANGKTLLEAAKSVRDEQGLTTDIRSIFYQSGETIGTTIHFDVEMIIPKSGIDDLGQLATANATFLHYTLELVYHAPLASDHTMFTDPGRALEITREELHYITKGKASQSLHFPHSREWRDSIVINKRSGVSFISTDNEGAKRTIMLHQDGGSSGRPRSLTASTLLRTVLSSTNAAESPTALLVRNEMRSWRLLQLEPSALRSPDSFDNVSSSQITVNGAHLPATLFRLARQRATSPDDFPAAQEQVYAEIANRLAELIKDVRDISIERNEQQQLLTLFLHDRRHSAYAARALSDGTLRFLALAVIESDPEAIGLLCMEEPENGIHPTRVAAMIKLLEALAVDTEVAVDSDNPLRQVIINTHSPVVVREVKKGNLLFAELVYDQSNGESITRVAFHPVSETWRVKFTNERQAVALGTILNYLELASSPPNSLTLAAQPHNQRLIDDRDIRQQLLFNLEEGA